MTIKKRNKIVFVLLTIMCMYIIGLFSFVFIVCGYENKKEEKLDAIVVLTGGTNRLTSAFNLFNNGVAEKLFISGVGGGAKLKAMTGLDMLSDEKKHMPELGRSANNTKENAEEVAKWVRMKKVSSLCLVTSDYHMPRSLLEFRAKMPKVKILPYVVAFDVEKKGYLISLRTFFMEYNKLIYAEIRILWEKLWKS